MSVRPVVAFILLFSFAAAWRCPAQGLKKGERPVYYSAQALASDCQTFVRVKYHPDGSAIRDEEQIRVTEGDLFEATRCNMYILGWLDAGLQSLDHDPPHYTPKGAAMSAPDLKTLIDTFLKYVRDHPQEEMYAASTILDVSLHTVAGPSR